MHHSICSELLLLHQRHLVDAPVAGLAADALLHVDAVVEVDEVRQVVHAHPVQRLVVAEAGAHRLEDRLGVEQLPSGSSCTSWSAECRERRRLDRRVAVAAIDAVVGHVVQVAELDRLFDVFVLRASRMTSARGPSPGGSRPPTSDRTPKRLTFESVLALRWKICGIGC